MPIPPNTTSTLQPSKVFYRTPSGFGTRVVQVEFIGSDPRITSWTEHFPVGSGATGSKVIPLTLFLSEILEFVEDARTKLRV